MDNNFKISIVIPIYNVKDYLKRALDSILNQTMDINDIQVIMVDDCSNDGSELIAKEYSQNYDNFLLFRLSQNSGSPGKPRNIGMEHINSKYVMFLDPDDEFMPDYCEKMYNTINRYGADLVKCNNVNIVNDVEFYNYYFDKNIHKVTINNSDKPLRYVTLWSAIHDVDFIKNNKITFYESIGEDIFFSVQEYIYMNQLIYLNDYFGYKYYIYEDSHAKSPTTENIHKLIEMFNESKIICDKNNRDDVFSVIFGQQIQGVFSRINNNNDQVKVKIKLLKEVYEFEKGKKLDIPNRGFRFINFLLMKRLFYMSLLFLGLISLYYKIVSKSSGSKVLVKIVHLFKK